MARDADTRIFHFTLNQNAPTKCCERTLEPSLNVSAKHDEIDSRLQAVFHPKFRHSLSILMTCRVTN